MNGSGVRKNSLNTDGNVGSDPQHKSCDQSDGIPFHPHCHGMFHAVANLGKPEMPVPSALYVFDELDVQGSVQGSDEKKTRVVSVDDPNSGHNISRIKPGFRICRTGKADFYLPVFYPGCTEIEFQTSVIGFRLGYDQSLERDGFRQGLFESVFCFDDLLRHEKSCEKENGGKDKGMMRDQSFTQKKEAGKPWDDGTEKQDASIQVRIQQDSGDKEHA